MSGKTIPAEKRLCIAMIRAGITDPTSQQGIDFCTDDCPYKYCVVFEHAAATKKVERIALAKNLRAHGVTVRDIALILGVRFGRAQKYIRE